MPALHRPSLICVCDCRAICDDATVFQLCRRTFDAVTQSRRFLDRSPVHRPDTQLRPFQLSSFELNWNAAYLAPCLASSEHYR